MADHVARSINIEKTNPHSGATDGAAVIDACSEVAINEALDKAFDATGYFAKAGKAAAIAAIAECDRALDAAAIAALEKKKGPELAAIAAASLADSAFAAARRETVDAIREAMDVAARSDRAATKGRLKARFGKKENAS